LVREELGKCYYREGVNHLEKCGHLRGKQKIHTSGGSIGNCRFSECVLMFCAFLRADRYLEQLKHSKVKGYLFQQQNYVPKE